MGAAIAHERLGAENELGPREWLVHHARYVFACQFAAGLDTLDAACGTGYGSSLLRRYGAAHVTGVDLSPEALAEARARHAAPGVTYVQADLLDLPFARPFGAVVSFETIEHLDEPDLALDALTSVLRPEGVLVCSTPNRALSNPGARRGDPPPNPFHRAELSRAELRAALRARFRDVRLYGQLVRMPGRFRRAQRVLEGASIWPTRLPLEPLYVVAVCRRPR